MIDYEYKLKFNHFGRMFGDFEEIINPAIAETWALASKILCNKTYKSEAGEIKIYADWQVLSHRKEELLEFDKTNPKQLLEYIKKLKEHIKPFTIDVVLTVPFEKKQQDSIQFDPYQGYIEHFLYEVFLIVNIACPGACDFNSLEISCKGGSDIYSALNVKLSPYFFEWAWIESLNRRWPVVQHMDLAKTKIWYYRTQLQTKLIAHSSVESAMLALLHICSERYLSPATVVWLTHGLEAIFDTRIGESFSGLLRRINLLVKVPEEYRKVLKKNLREFYDLRSAFVHGGHKLAHPLPDDGIDKEFQGYFSRILNASNFSATIYVAVLQELVRRNWIQIEFKERIVGA